MSHDDKLSCFGCHATNAAAGRELTLDRMAPGLQCERCHQATDAHLAAMARNSNLPAVPPGLTGLQNLSAEQVSNFCGQCHRTWTEIAMQARPGIANVRFQPYRLTETKCYDPDDTRISCLACHDPHTEASAKPVDYDARCQACHPGGNAKANPAQWQRAAAPRVICLKLIYPVPTTGFRTIASGS
jgi:Zn finger protein HypA/HybF involved in hydrogenase expression